MESESAVTYNVYVDFIPDENTRYGMSAVVTTLNEEIEAEDSTEETDDEGTGETETQPVEADDARQGERHEAFDPNSRPGEPPQGEEEVTDDAQP